MFCKKELNCIKSKKTVLSLLYYFWEKNTGLDNMFKTRKKSTKIMLILVITQCYQGEMSNNLSPKIEAVTQRCSAKKVLLEILQNSQENTEKETLPKVFSCEFCEISKNTSFHRTPQVVDLMVASFVKRCCITLG